jgi:hypothetical protein
MKKPKMTREEVSFLGVVAARKAIALLKEERISEYYKSSKKCLFCGKAIPYEQKRKKFCNHSCAASFNNVGVRRNGDAPSCCLWCGKTLKSSSGKYCDGFCQSEFIHKNFIDGWMSGNIQGGGSSFENLSSHIRRWLVERYGKKCSICGVEIWNGEPVPLVVDHIDGNPTNHCSENLRFVCRNCDGLLPTFSGKNLGRGRTHRRKKRQEGKVMGS